MIKQRKYDFLLKCLIVMILLPACTLASVHVSASGDDSSGDGTFDLPYKSIGRALQDGNEVLLIGDFSNPTDCELELDDDEEIEISGTGNAFNCPAESKWEIKLTGLVVHNISFSNVEFEIEPYDDESVVVFSHVNVTQGGSFLVKGGVEFAVANCRFFDFIKTDEHFVTLDIEKPASFDRCFFSNIAMEGHDLIHVAEAESFTMGLVSFTFVNLTDSRILFVEGKAPTMVVEIVHGQFEQLNYFGPESGTVSLEGEFGHIKIDSTTFWMNWFHSTSSTQRGLIEMVFESQTSLVVADNHFREVTLSSGALFNGGYINLLDEHASSCTFEKNKYEQSVIDGSLVRLKGTGEYSFVEEIVQDNTVTRIFDVTLVESAKFNLLDTTISRMKSLGIIVIEDSDTILPAVTLKDLSVVGVEGPILVLSSQSTSPATSFVDVLFERSRIHLVKLAAFKYLISGGTPVHRVTCSSNEFELISGSIVKMENVNSIKMNNNTFNGIIAQGDGVLLKCSAVETPEFTSSSVCSAGAPAKYFQGITTYSVDPCPCTDAPPLPGVLCQGGSWNVSGAVNIPPGSEVNVTRSVQIEGSVSLSGSDVYFAMGGSVQLTLNTTQCLILNHTTLHVVWNDPNADKSAVFDLLEQNPECLSLLEQEFNVTFRDTAGVRSQDDVCFRRTDTKLSMLMTSCGGNSSSDRKKWIIIGCVVGGFVLLVAIAVVVVLLVVQAKRPHSKAFKAQTRQDESL